MYFVYQCIMQITMISWLIPIAVGCLLAPAAFGELTPVNLLRQPGFKDCGENTYNCSFFARIFLPGIFSLSSLLFAWYRYVYFFPCLVFFSLGFIFSFPGMFSCLTFFSFIFYTISLSFFCLISVRVFFPCLVFFFPWFYFFLFLACSLKLFVIPRENRRFTSKVVCLMVHGYTSVPR